MVAIQPLMLAFGRLENSGALEFRAAEDFSGPGLPDATGSESVALPMILTQYSSILGWNLS